MIELAHVTKKYGKKTVLDDVSLTLEKGCYGLLGPNGAGKTTLIQSTLGIIRINKGSIQRKKDKDVGYLPQKLTFFEEATVNEMLYYFTTVKKIEKKDREIEIERVLKKVNLLEKKDERIKKLSGGMKQRMGIAQAILGDPQLIMLDEPTVGLDPEERKRFKELIVNMKEEKTVLISSHIVSDIEEICDRVIIMNQGKIIQDRALEKMELEKYYLETVNNIN
ncbi:MAG: ATP-binding cassette domain-containing protein [Alphaproteobacteria bacterium]|nr:ATP-binding cassette domain-containing protein [Alphaproteobacteria bacterium]